MKKYICECCGGTINPATLKCEYCGTCYRDENDSIIKIETFHNPVKVYEAECAIPDYVARNENASEFILNRLANQLATRLVENMDIQIAENYNPRDMEIKVRGRVKVIVPERHSDFSLFDKYNRY